ALGHALDQLLGIRLRCAHWMASLWLILPTTQKGYIPEVDRNSESARDRAGTFRPVPERGQSAARSARLEILIVELIARPEQPARDQIEVTRFFDGGVI